MLWALNCTACSAVVYIIQRRPCAETPALFAFGPFTMQYHYACGQLHLRSQSLYRKYISPCEVRHNHAWVCAIFSCVDDNRDCSFRTLTMRGTDTSLPSQHPLPCCHPGNCTCTQCVLILLYVWGRLQGFACGLLSGAARTCTSAREHVRSGLPWQYYRSLSGSTWSLPRRARTDLPAALGCPSLCSNFALECNFRSTTARWTKQAAWRWKDGGFGEGRNLHTGRYFRRGFLWPHGHEFPGLRFDNLQTQIWLLTVE